MAPYAVGALRRAHHADAPGRINVAAVATAFPSGRASRSVKLSDTADAVAAGADEIDMVIDRGAFLSGRYGLVSVETLDDSTARITIEVTVYGSSQLRVC